MGDEGSFGRHLRLLREEAGLTQEQLAERAGLSAKAISLLERGERRRPYPHTVGALAEALDLTAEQRAALAGAVRRAAAGPARPRSPGRQAAASSWPVPPTPLIGRDTEVREVARLLTDGSTRLVTLTGIGGVGKTRLALAVLPRVVGHFGDGATYVSLAPVAEPALVAPTLVRALGLAESGGEPLEVLSDYLAGRSTLLVLDNLEHLLGAAPDLAALLALAEGPAVLATSRAPLRLRGEVEYPVGPLWAPSTERPSVDAVAGSPAGRLFVDRARAASPVFELTEDNAADVSTICRRLAGIPLALELAAAHVRHVGPGQLLARLDAALHEEGARDLPERHRTLRRTLDWSHDLLDRSDQRLLARLSVFAGGFDLDAAESVGGAPDATDAVVGGLGRLVEQSLVVAEPVGPGGDLRYRMLEPVRQYAAARLDACGDADDVRLTHALYYLAVAEHAYPLVEGAEQVHWLDRLTLDNDNFRSAIAWALASGRREVAVDLGWALRMYWLMRDRRTEGRRMLEHVLPHADRLAEPVRARLLHTLAFCHYGFGGPQRGLAQAAAELFRGLGDRQGEEYALGQLGFAHLVEGDLDTATTVLQQALAITDEHADDVNAAHVLNHLSVVPLRRGDPAAASVLAEQALRRTDRTGERLARQTSLQILAQAAWAQGEHERARGFFRSSLRVAVELADPVNIGYCLRGLAISDGAGAGSVTAAKLLGAADGLLEGAGYPLFAWAVGQIDAAVAAAEQRAGDDEAWRAGYDDGRAADTDEVVRRALDTP